MRNFILNWKDCNDKEDRQYCLADSQDSIVGFTMFSSKKNKHYDENKNRLYKIMSEEKFMKTCKKMSKKSALVNLEPAFTTVILDFLESNQVEPEIADEYMTISKKISKEKIKDLKKKVDLPEALVFVCYGTMPDKDLVNNPKVMGKFINKALSRMYSYANAMSLDDVSNISSEELKVLMKKVFGKDSLSRVVVTLALEGKSHADKLNDSGKVLFSKFTEFMLDELSDEKKSNIEAFFDLYITQRKKSEQYDKDFPRRIDFTELLNSDKYDRLNKVINDIKDTDDVKYIK